MLSHAGARTTDIEDGELNAKLTKLIEQLTAPGASLITVPLKHGSAEVFVESIEPPAPLVIFGAGHDAIPVVRLAKELGWHVTVVDHRSAYATSARFPLADQIVLAAPEDVLSRVRLAEDTLALVMTHNYLRDLKLLETLLPSPVRYLGQLGPRKRTEQLLADLRQRGIHPEPGQLSRLYAPVGLDIGSESPAEVALSVLAEMLAVIANHRGGFGRERNAHIHNRSAAQFISGTA
jgi:xanthine/CO dehydrogenase XdhC/CoxF family maturation factor